MGTLTNVQWDLMLTSKRGSAGSPPVPSGDWDTPFFSGYSQLSNGQNSRADKTPENIFSSGSRDTVETGQTG